MKPPRTKSSILPAAAAALLFGGAAIAPAHPAAPKRAAAQASWWSPAVTQALAHAGKNKTELVAALNQTPAAQREGMQFLITNMPQTDLQTLSAKFLLENVALAYHAWNVSPWKAQIPKQVFLNDVLPYASLNEARDGSRKRLVGLSAPLVVGAKTPGDAAQMINQKLFPLVKVKYSTERNRPDQAPTETMASGKATCSGLSILLVDACRAVGVPARVVGTPLWANNRGNHTWVEVWDGAKWRFTGAAEPDEKGLDHGWFVGDAAQATATSPEHAIYASSFQKTGLPFPLVWGREIKWVQAVNVTSRYAAAIPVAPVAAGKTRVIVSVLDPKGRRAVADVTMRDITNGAAVWTGKSLGETADRNNYLTFDVPRKHSYEIAVAYAEKTTYHPFVTGDEPEEKSEIRLEATPAVKPLSAAVTAQLKTALADYFTAPADKQAAWKFPKALDSALKDNEPTVRALTWSAYKAAPIHATMKHDYDANQATFGEYLSPYTVRAVGTKPANGWGLYIAMHGGGSGPKEMNDSQWEIMKTHYKDHPEAAGGYLLLALRAPNDTWNGFYDNYVYPLIANLRQQFLLFGDVDPNKVYAMGYSHGGYGAYAIGPKEPDLFAAIHASAGAVTDGEAVPQTLRNTVFTVMAAGLDNAYNRLDRTHKFIDDVNAARGNEHDAFPVGVQIMEGVEHSGLPDRDKIADMAYAVRNTTPRKLTWLMTDDVIHDFFWLRTSDPGKTKEIDATCKDNQVIVTTTPIFTLTAANTKVMTTETLAAETVKSATVLLDSRLVSFDKPITFVVNGKKSVKKIAPSLKTLCATMARRGDPDLAFAAEVVVK
jgi:transglutaminase-like putative cysteine protease